ncbi:MAG: FkbM family methyltransferase [Planctomycetaceae bacterium]|jgi:FkbM family methyltransferase|nr:FkbM family methyltransferase [Planctomycetaceae bacterium]
MKPYKTDLPKNVFSIAFWCRILSWKYWVRLPKRLKTKWYWSIWKRTTGKKRYGIGVLESFARCGEDLIALHIWKEVLGRSGYPNYLDIGAHHPEYESNTCLFYKNGSRGINIEPDPMLFERFLIQRPEDINLNFGIGFEKNEEAEFFVMQTPTLNTFSREVMEQMVNIDRHKLNRIIKIPMRTIVSVLDEHGNKTPDFVSIDVEGLDDQIVKSWDFVKYRPAIFCIETGVSRENYAKIAGLMMKSGYMPFESTNLNTFFVEGKLLKERE